MWWVSLQYKWGREWEEYLPFLCEAESPSCDISKSIFCRSQRIELLNLSLTIHGRSLLIHSRVHWEKELNSNNDQSFEFMSEIKLAHNVQFTTCNICRRKNCQVISIREHIPQVLLEFYVKYFGEYVVLLFHELQLYAWVNCAINAKSLCSSICHALHLTANIFYNQDANGNIIQWSISEFKFTKNLSTSIISYFVLFGNGIVSKLLWSRFHFLLCAHATWERILKKNDNLSTGLFHLMKKSSFLFVFFIQKLQKLQ